MTTAQATIDVDAMAAPIRLVMADFPSDLVITGQSRFVEDLGMDSINRLMLVTVLEESFAVQLEPHMSKLGEMHTVADVVTFLRGLKGLA